MRLNACESREFRFRNQTNICTISICERGFLRVENHLERIMRVILKMDKEINSMINK